MFLSTKGGRKKVRRESPTLGQAEIMVYPDRMEKTFEWEDSSYSPERFTITSCIRYLLYIESYSLQRDNVL